MNTATKTQKLNKASSIMQTLMQSAEENVVIPQIGEPIEGTVFEIGSNAVYIDLGRLGAGVVRGEELQAGLGSTKGLHIGDKVTAIIEELSNEEGYMELSFRQASIEKTWNDLKEKMEAKEVIKTKILVANKGGLVVEISGIQGFLPVSQLLPEHYPRVEDSDKGKILSKLKDFVGQTFSIRIIDADENAKKLIVSEKAIQEEERKAALDQFNIGDVITGKISGVVDFGAFVKFESKAKSKEDADSDKTEDERKLEGLVHISELAWQLIDDPRDIVKIGDEVSAKIIGIEEDGRVSLSIKELKKNPWENVEEKYKVGSKAKGKVSKINNYGAFVYLDDDIHGLVHISELAKYKNAIKEGEEYDFEILNIEPKEHKMGLKLYQEKTKETKESKKDKEKSKSKKAEKEEPEEENPPAEEKEACKK